MPDQTHTPTLSADPSKELSRMTLSDLSLSDIQTAHIVLETLSDHLRGEIRRQANVGDTFACDLMHQTRDEIDAVRQSLQDELAAIEPEPEPISPEVLAARIRQTNALIDLLS